MINQDDEKILQNNDVLQDFSFYCIFENICLKSTSQFIKPSQQKHKNKR